MPFSSFQLKTFTFLHYLCSIVQKYVRYIPPFQRHILPLTLDNIIRFFFKISQLARYFFSILLLRRRTYAIFKIMISPKQHSWQKKSAKMFSLIFDFLIAVHNETVTAKVRGPLWSFPHKAKKKTNTSQLAIKEYPYIALSLDLFWNSPPSDLLILQTSWSPAILHMSHNIPPLDTVPISSNAWSTSIM